MRIFRYLKKYWFFAILAPLFMIGEVAMDLLQPQLMAIIVDKYLPIADIENIISGKRRSFTTMVIKKLRFSARMLTHIIGKTRRMQTGT